MLQEFVQSLINFLHMETPSSTRRVTRSQTMAAVSNNSNTTIHINNIPVSRKTEDSEKALSKSRQTNGKQQDRSVLTDITNDSPIVGLAGGNLKTPSSSIVKQKFKNTPGSGEALLRGQVKTLLQKVEEEAVPPKISLESRPFLQLVNSPVGMLAPTPANTPQISNLSGEVSVIPQAIQEHSVSQVVVNQESPDSEKNQITRSLLMDFSDKSEISDLSECSSDLTYQEVVGGGKDMVATEDDDASIWSIQVNASTHDEDEEEVAEGEEEEEYYDENEDEEYDDGGLIDELCEGLNRISVKESVAPKFEGKHTRFVYNSDDELVGEEEEEEEGRGKEEASPSVLRLKGLPTPKGKHLRFPEEEDRADMAL